MQTFLAPTTPLEAVPLTFVDVETTGLDAAAGDRVCEIALLRVQGEREVARLESLVNPLRPMTPGATAVNGITDAMLATAPLFAALLPQIRTLLQHTVLVAHNAPFDLGFLHHEFQLAGQSLPTLPVVDTLILARGRYHFPRNSLETVAAVLGVHNAGQHRAMADVLTTRQVFQCFITDMRRDGPVTLAHLLSPSVPTPPLVSPTLIATLQEALQSGQRLRIRYQAGSRRETSRVVEPLELCYERGHTYLRAFCHLRQEERHFRLDRIVEFQILTEE